MSFNKRINNMKKNMDEGKLLSDFNENNKIPGVRKTLLAIQYKDIDTGIVFLSNRMDSNHDLYPSKDGVWLTENEVKNNSGHLIKEYRDCKIVFNTKIEKPLDEKLIKEVGTKIGMFLTVSALDHYYNEQEKRIREHKLIKSDYIYKRDSLTRADKINSLSNIKKILNTIEDYSNLSLTSIGEVKTLEKELTKLVKNNGDFIDN